MEDFSRVSLGFAEFVSQLLYETFEATLSAQHYQIEKYAEIEKILSLSNERFFDLYIDNYLLEEKILDIFGVKITNQMLLPIGAISIIEDKFDDISGFINSGKLSDIGFNAINEYALNKLVSERKGTLQSIISKTELTRLVVESGEIRAKLELTSLSQNESEEKEIDPDLSKKSKDAVSVQTSLTKESGKELSSVFSGRSILSNNIRMTEIKDSETNEKTLIIDKSTVTDRSEIKYSIPSVRIIAKPATVSSNSNLLSEIVIKFRTV